MQIFDMAEMTKNYQISIYLDTRREKKNKKYPVKLRVFTSNPRKQKLYPTKLEFSKEEFSSIWETQKPRGEHKSNRIVLQEIENKANQIADSIEEFSFEEFENLIAPEKARKRHTVNDYYEDAIAQYRHNDKYGTASNYKYSLRSLLNFQGNDILHFKTITVQWLKDYQANILHQKKTRSTVGIYLRPLRAIFNTAIADNALKSDFYPFGKGKYQIPNPKTVKTALSKENLKELLNGIPKTEEQEKAKAFWFFSYACNGMNIKDVAYLKYKDVTLNDTIVFFREKIIDTNVEQKPIIIYLNKFTKNVIKAYGNKKINGDTYLFPIVDALSNKEEQDRTINNFNRYINQHINKYAKSINLDVKINPKIARHSFATNLIRNGAGMEFAQESLGHSNIKTTQHYFAGFEDEQKRKIAINTMNFE